MSHREYKVVPFVGQLRTGPFSNEGLHKTSLQLQTLIQEHVNAGWRFAEVAHMSILAEPGFFASLLGGRAAVLTYDHVIFYRE